MGNSEITTQSVDLGKTTLIYELLLRIKDYELLRYKYTNIHCKILFQFIHHTVWNHRSLSFGIHRTLSDITGGRNDRLQSMSEITNKRPKSLSPKWSRSEITDSFGRSPVSMLGPSR